MKVQRLLRSVQFARLRQASSRSWTIRQRVLLSQLFTLLALPAMRMPARR